MTSRCTELGEGVKEISGIPVINVDLLLGWRTPDAFVACGHLLPTINGWLLGYPVVYALMACATVSASAMLSSCSLHVYEIFLPCHLLPRGQNTRKQEPTKSALTDAIYSFSTPAGFGQGDRLAVDSAIEIHLCSLSTVVERAQSLSVWGPLNVRTFVKDNGHIVL